MTLGEFTVAAPCSVRRSAEGAMPPPGICIASHSSIEGS